MGSYRIGIDLGGTKISVILFDAERHVLLHERTSTPKNDYEGTIEAIASLVDLARQKIGSNQSATIGIGIPGSIAPHSGQIQNANSVWLNDRLCLQDLEARLDQTIRMANDANCLVLSEWTDGSAKGARSVFGVIIGTGCGGALITEGQLVEGRRRAGGEWGHVSLPWPKPEEVPGHQCWCGQYGCMETWVSGPAVERLFAKEANQQMSVQEIVSLAASGDQTAQKILDEHAERLARGLAMVVNIFDPQLIVLGGGLSNLQNLYEKLPDLMAPYIFAHNKQIDIVPPKHGDDSGVRGAAFLGDN